MDGIIDSMDMSLSKLREIAKDRDAWRAIVHGVATEQQQQWIRGENKCSEACRAVGRSQTEGKD